jgi:hypothetical protein
MDNQEIKKSETIILTDIQTIIESARVNAIRSVDFN